MKNFGAQDMVSPLKKVLMQKPQRHMSKVDGKKWNYISPMYQNLIDNNYNEFQSIIKESGIEIIEMNINNENNELCDSVFTHDPSLVINEGAIILNMKKILRKIETIEHKKLYQKINIPIIGEIKNEGTVEGGDCLWLNNKTLLVGESNRTNIEGIRQLDTILKLLNIKLIHIKLPELYNENNCFHLMSMVSILDYDLAIGYKQLFPKELINILHENKIRLLEMPEDEFIKSKTLAVNVLALSPRNVITLKGYIKTLDLLSKSDCKINLFSGDELCIKAEGGPTCLTRAVWRD